MNIISNDQLIQRNRRIANIANLLGMAVLVGGLYITFAQPQMMNLSFLALAIGYILTQIGIYLMTRYGRSPRPDEQLNIALKGLDKRYSIYHHSSPVSHFLVGPAGLWVLLPKYQRGKITYERNRWRQRGGLGLMFSRIMAQEGIGRPDLEIEAELKSLNTYINKNLPEADLPPAEAVLIFTNPSTDLQIENAPTPTIPLRNLKEFIRKKAKSKNLSEERADKLNDRLMFS